MGRSAVWKYFEENKKDSTLAKCLLCVSKPDDIKRGIKLIYNQYLSNDFE